MSEKPQQLGFFIQDPFTEEVRGPFNVPQVKEWYASGGVEDWGVSKSATGPWTPASSVKGLAPSPPASMATGLPPALPLEQSPALTKTSGAVDGSSGQPHRLRAAISTKNSFPAVIGIGVGLFLAGVAIENDVAGGIGVWTAIAGAVAMIVRWRAPAFSSKIFAKASPVLIGAIVLLLLGGLVFLSSVAADTTVHTGTSFGRVHNIGLMNRQRNGMTVGGVLMAAGLALGGFHLHRNQGGGVASIGKDTKLCPKCGEVVKQAAILCKHCKSDIG